MKKESKPQDQDSAIPQESARLSKLSPPFVSGIYLRHSLFERLDKIAGKRLLWLAAPAGSGKTMLIASYVQARGIATHWYYLDEGDRDPASFFHYLGIMGNNLAPERPPLPALSPEYRGGEAVFTRNFFRELFSRMGEPALLVFDDFHKLPSQVRCHEWLAAAFGDIPDTVTVVVLSRGEPPAAYARWQLASEFCLLGWEDLRLDLAETQGVATAQGLALAQPTIEKIHDYTDGWMAGTILLLNQHNRFEASEIPVRTRQQLFDYFSAELLEQSPDTLRPILLTSAVLPRFTADMLREISASDMSRDTLIELLRGNYFLRHYPDKHGRDVYEYHALFHDFLLQRARTELDGQQWRELQKTGVEILQRYGFIEEAASLLCDLNDQQSLSRLIMSQAQAWLLQGRFETLEHWLACIDAAQFGAQPWLCYWRGMALVPTDIRKGREWLVRAYSGLEAGADAVAAYLPLCAILESYIFEWDDYSPIPRWMDRLERLRAKFPAPKDPAVENAITAAGFSALCFAFPHDSRLGEYTQRAHQLVVSQEAAGHHVSLAASLAAYCTWLGKLRELHELLPLVRRQATQQAGSILSRLHSLVVLVEIELVLGNLTVSEQVLHDALEQAGKMGVHGMDSILIAHLCMVQGATGQLSAFADSLERFKTTLVPERRLDIALYHHQAGYLALLKRDYVAAYNTLATSQSLVESLQCYIPRNLNNILLVQALVGLERYEEAHALAEETLAYSRQIGSVHHELLVLFALAWSALRREDQAALQHYLRRALEMGRERGFFGFLSWDSTVMPVLLGEALKRDIETDYVRDIIRKRGLLPPEDLPEAWPWQIKIYTLGRFSIVRDGQTLRFEGKAQKKPLELLKALLSMGGRNVDELTLAEALWPDADGDMALRSLKSTLHRLRKLIGHEALELSEGRLTLDPRYCWVDSWTLERLLNQIEQQLNHQPDPTVLGRDMHRALQLYTGPFLGEEIAPAHGLARRERLRSRMLRITTHAGELMLQAGASALTELLYTKALEIDPLAESLYQGLMKFYGQNGQVAEVKKTYHRCQEALAAMLDIAPCEQTRRIYQRQLASPRS